MDTLHIHHGVYTAYAPWRTCHAYLELHMLSNITILAVYNMLYWCKTAFGLYLGYLKTTQKLLNLYAVPPTHPLIRTFMTKKIRTPHNNSRISRCTKSEHSACSNPPTHWNPNIVWICKSVRIIGRSCPDGSSGFIFPFYFPTFFSGFPFIK